MDFCNIAYVKMNRDLQLKVECYSGYRSEETPRYLWLGIRRVEVKEILDQWLAPDHRYFKIRGDDHAVYIIRHDTGSWDWELVLFKQDQKADDSEDGSRVTSNLLTASNRLQRTELKHNR